MRYATMTQIIDDGSSDSPDNGGEEKYTDEGSSGTEGSEEGGSE